MAKNLRRLRRFGSLMERKRPTNTIDRGENYECILIRSLKEQAKNGAKTRQKRCALYYCSTVPSRGVAARAWFVTNDPKLRTLRRFLATERHGKNTRLLNSSVFFPCHHQSTSARAAQIFLRGNRERQRFSDNVMPLH